MLHPRISFNAASDVGLNRVVVDLGLRDADRRDLGVDEHSHRLGGPSGALLTRVNRWLG